MKLPWPWNSRLIFVRPSELLYCKVREFLGSRESVLDHLSNERTIDAVVFAKLKHDTIRIILHPGVGLSDGGFHVEVPLSLVAQDLRIPNTPLSVTVQNGEIVRIGPADHK